MSDGLLKKRIAEKTHEYQFVESIGGIAYLEDGIKATDFEEILDEAKQDFIFKMKGLDTDNPQYNEIETFLKIRSDIFVWKWFERWFGDIEK